MTGFGYTLRTAREAKGLSVQQLAGMTNMMVRTVTDLEQEDFSKIAAPIYGRGFIKLYCEAVAIDPKPLIAEFMAIYNGEKPPSAPIAMPAPQSAPRPQPAPTPEPVVAPSPAATTESAVTPSPGPAPRPVPAAPKPTDDLFSQPTAEPPSNPLPPPSRFSRYAADIAEEPPHRVAFRLPPNCLRILIVAAAAVALILALFFGIRGLYRLAMKPPATDAAGGETTPTVTRVTPSATAVATPSPATRRASVQLPPFYAD